MVYLIYTDFELLPAIYKVPSDWVELVKDINGKICNSDELTYEQVNTFTCISEGIYHKEWLPLKSSEPIQGTVYIAGWAS